MPELPEVETILRYLRSELNCNSRYRRITNLIIYRNDIVGHPAPKVFTAQIKNRRIRRIDRKGKYLIFDLEGGLLLIIHLRLSGHLRFVREEPVLKYERVRFRMDNGLSLAFIEPRALGRVYLLKEQELPSVLKGLSQMGLEPIDPNFTPEYLQQRLKRRKANIKSLLLDQRICAGVGNIYSDEALFYAGIKPTRKAEALTGKEISSLTEALRRVLNDGIKYGGTTMKDKRYLLPDGTAGSFQQQLRVFNRESLPCFKCGSKIRRIKIGNRSSYFCPSCQR